MMERAKGSNSCDVEMGNKYGPRISFLLLVLVSWWPSACPGIDCTNNNAKIKINHPPPRLLWPFLTPRPPGSAAHLQTQCFIREHFERLVANDPEVWTFEIDQFEREICDDDSDCKVMTFTNLVATWRPEASQFIVLAAHYDTKKWILRDDGAECEGCMVGALDSGWSCAWLLWIGEIVARENFYNTLTSKDGSHPNNVGLKIVFFDGEEDLDPHQSSPPITTDNVDIVSEKKHSLFGSRHLANKWSTYGTISKIKLFILLDLLGGGGGEDGESQIYSFFSETWPQFWRLVQIERNLLGPCLERVTGANDDEQRCIFVSKRAIRGIIKHSTKRQKATFLLQDDHVPFAERGVPVLHLIPLPFPKQWHTIHDDSSALDANVCDRLSLVLTEFVLELLRED